LGSADGWRAEFGRELNATNDRACFGPSGLPVLEGKHIQPFTTDVAAATCRIDREAARQRIRSGGFARERLAYRDVSGVSNRLSLIAAIIPAETATTHTLFCLRSRVPINRQHFLCGLLNSYVLNALVRMLMGGHLTTTLIEGLPVPPWTGSAAERRIARLARRLSRAPCRAEIHARLQAAVARLYGLTPAVFNDVLSRFPLVPDLDRRRAFLAFERRHRAGG
jgi:predicted nucleic acid-binding protein